MVEWLVDPVSGKLELVYLAQDSRRLFAVPFDGGDAVRFGEVRASHTFEDFYVEDMTPLPEGRMVVLLQDRQLADVDRFDVVIGGLDSN
jgi:hypothetical protein